MKHLLFPFIFLFFWGSLGAQSHADCALALEICNKQPIILPLIYGPGNDSLELDNTVCSAGFPNFESSTAWVRWRVAQGGTFWFIIYPLNPDDDIDFFVYKLFNGDCAQKTSVRCMVAGDFSSSSPCMGPTGLLPGENDINGPPGCLPGTNNFLAPIDVVAGEEYALAINNFSSSLDSVRVEFCGTALLECDTESCDFLDTKSVEEGPHLSIGAILPNPSAAGANARLPLFTSKSQTILLQLMTPSGKTIFKEEHAIVPGSNSIDLQTAHLPAGVYFVVVQDEHSIASRRLVLNQ